MNLLKKLMSNLAPTSLPPGQNPIVKEGVTTSNPGAFGQGNLARASTSQANQGRLAKPEMDWKTGFMVPPPSPPPKPTPDPWEVKFKARLYWTENQSFESKPITVKEIACRAGVRIFIEGDSELLAECQRRRQENLKATAEAGYASVQARFIKIIFDNEAAIKRGELPGCVPDREDLIKQATIRIRQLGDDRRGIENLTKPIFERAALKLQKAARECAVQLDAEERKQAESFGIEFAPSPWLRLVVQVAIDRAARALSGMGPETIKELTGK